MPIRSVRIPTASVGLLALAALALLAGCSAPAGGGASSAATDTGDGGTSPSSASSAAATSGSDACALVTETVLTTALGTDPGASTSQPGNGGTGSSTCHYADNTIVQVSLQADTYLPGSLYSPSTVDGAVAPAVGDRGYVASEGVLVVKGQTGVLVTWSHPATIAQGQALVAAVFAGLPA